MAQNPPNVRPLQKPRTAQTVKKADDIYLDIGVDKAQRMEVAEAVAGLLASTYLLYLKTLYYHWNVTGPHFVELHGLFERQYEKLHEAGDGLAERIRALGHFTPGTVSEFLDFSSVQDDAKLPETPEIMVENLLMANEQCSREAREVLEVAERAGDEVTLDMAISRMRYHDKAAWMLRSILE